MLAKDEVIKWVQRALECEPRINLHRFEDSDLSAFMREVVKLARGLRAGSDE